MANTTWAVEKGHFPFPVQIHLKQYIEQWRSAYSTKNKNAYGESIQFIEHTLKTHPFLSEPLEDIGLLQEHSEFLDLLFAPVLPQNGLNNALLSVTGPFSHLPVIAATESYHRLVQLAEGQFELVDLSILKEHSDYRVLYAYKYILKKFYDLDLKVDQPAISSFVHFKTGLTRYFKLSGSIQFLDVVNLKPLPTLDRQVIQKLLDQDFDPAVWKSVLPPDIFLFSGLSVISLVDITIEEALARLQHILLDHHDVNDAGWFINLQQQMRNLFRLPGLRLGVATLEPGGELNFTSRSPLLNSLLLHEQASDCNSWFQGCLYEEILEKKETIIIEDLKKQSNELNAAVQLIIDAGYRNLLLAPLVYNGNMIGILELACAIPGEINGLSLFKVNQVKPIFANALKQQTDAFEGRVEALMLKQFTSIHPVIQWRFRKAAINLLDCPKNNDKEEEIYFENVYPFYGSLDIRNSSIKRNLAIKKDLVYNLENALMILQQAYEMLSFDILGELMSDIEKSLESVRTSFSTDDEVTVTEFIRKEINPVMLHLLKLYPRLFTSSKLFSEIISSDHGICNSNRLAYEEALLLVNRCIVNCLEEEEADLQRLYPCYFEKYRTDGVEYNIYTGASIAPGRPFDPLYLDNLQLRQLIWTCRIMRKLDELQPRVQTIFEQVVPSTANDQPTGDRTGVMFEIAPLIFAYSIPITLKFRVDEKRLDVDGSYNVRYEMMKKRIDKALVRGTLERLTQPGHIAVVYSRENEAAAYIRHLNYLVKKEFIEPEWEQLNIEPLQDVEGLKAIRAKTRKNIAGS